MAKADWTVHVDTTDGAKELIAELRAAKEALSEERIRKIVREELAILMIKPSIQAPGYQQYEVK